LLRFFQERTKFIFVNKIRRDEVRGKQHSYLGVGQCCLDLRKALRSEFESKSSGPAVGVDSDPLSGFQGAVIFEKIGDAGRPE